MSLYAAQTNRFNNVDQGLVENLYIAKKELITVNTVQMEGDNSMITYRQANQNDFFAALVLWFKIRDELIAPEHEDVNPNYADRVKNSMLLKKYESGERVMLIALDGEKIVGAIGVDYNENAIKGPLCVDREYHRQGIATELLSRVVCELKMRGSEIIEINSSLHALPFYKNFGFVQTGSERLYNGFLSIPMEYNLQLNE